MSHLDEALELLLARTHRDPELAAALRTLLEGVLARLPEPGPVAGPVPESAPVAVAPAEPASAPEAELNGETTGALTDEITFVEWPELGAVGRNLQLKAGACRWVAAYGYTEEPAALGERYALLDHAKAAGCFLWMFDRVRVNPYNTAGLTTLAELFELTAQALNFWRDAGDTPEERAADHLLADAQAAVRAAAWTLAGYSDPDQYDLYKALKLSAQASRTYLPQLSLGYRPPALGELTVRLAALGEARQAREARARASKKLYGKAHYHIKLVAKNPADMAQWRKVDEAVRELLAQGEAVAGLLEPLRGRAVPPDLSRLAALLRLPLAAPPAPVGQTSFVPAAPQLPESASEAVRRVGQLLAGREILIVGGDERKEAVAGLAAAFGCRVRWLETAPHTSLSLLEPAVTESVAVVLLLIRWSSHVYGELAHVCKARGVPLVRLAGGYNPNRVAHDVLGQAAARLSPDSRPDNKLDDADDTDDKALEHTA